MEKNTSLGAVGYVHIACHILYSILIIFEGTFRSW